MKLFLDCEFSQLNQESKLISLALVSETGEEYYVELTDTYLVDDCSDFVIQHVLPQLDLQRHGLSMIDAQASLRKFLNDFDDPLEVCSDAPEWDWGFFCQLADANHRWPSHVANQPTNLIQLLRYLDADDIADVALPELPHHALLDARVLAGLYQLLSSANPAVEQ
jgi:hypothetical protein